jgi:hypothetical protein
MVCAHSSYLGHPLPLLPMLFRSGLPLRSGLLGLLAIRLLGLTERLRGVLAERLLGLAE